MTSVGMIHIACYCGAELFYLGNRAAGNPPTEVIQKLKTKLGSDTIGFFSSADGDYGDCPYCGLTYELPDPELLDWLPYLEKDQFTSQVNDIRGSKTNGKAKKIATTPAPRYIL